MRSVIRVVHVTSSLTTRGAGVREVVLNLSKSLSQELDLEVYVVGLKDSLWEIEKYDWSDIVCIPLPVLGPGSFGFSKSLTKTLIELEADIIHLHGLWMYPAKAVLDWHLKTSKPYIVSTHGMLSQVALSYGKWKKDIVSLLFHNRFLSNAVAIHSTSDLETIEIRDFGLTNKIIQVPNGVIIPEISDSSGSDCYKVISIGRIHKKKGLSNLLWAWKSLQNRFPNWSLEIVGGDDGGELSRLKTLSTRLCLNRVSFLNAVTGDSKWAVFRSASIFVLPTLSENFALTVAESLACGIPVVCSKGAPWPGLESFRCGKWVDIGVDPLINALDEVMSLSEDERHEMGLNGRNWMQRDFSWSSISKNFAIKYRDLVSLSHF